MTRICVQCAQLIEAPDSCRCKPVYVPGDPLQAEVDRLKVENERLRAENERLLAGSWLMEETP